MGLLKTTYYPYMSQYLISCKTISVSVFGKFCNWTRCNNQLWGGIDMCYFKYLAWSRCQILSRSDPLPFAYISLFLTIMIKYILGWIFKIVYYSHSIYRWEGIQERTLHYKVLINQIPWLFEHSIFDGWFPFCQALSTSFVYMLLCCLWVVCVLYLYSLREEQTLT